MANCIRCGRQLPGLTFGKKICQWCVQHEAAQRGDLADDAPQIVMPTPWVRRESSVGLTQIILGINVAVFLGMVISSGDPAAFANPLQEFSTRETVLWGANVGTLTLSGEWWRLLTCVFVHGYLLHIAFNMWCLWNLGELSESLYGRWTYIAVYLISGLGASLASVTWNPYRPSVGASGAIFGLAGALIAAFKLGEFSVPRAALSGTLRSLLVFVGFNLILGARPGSATDNAAHIGGLITGLIVGALIALVAPQRDHTSRRVAVILVLTLVLAGGAIGLARYYGLPLRLGRSPFPHASNLMRSRRGTEISALDLDSSGRYPSAFLTANSAPWNPMRLCVPSQNGLFTEPPQRQREKAGLPVRSYWVPFTSTSSIEPSGASTRYGPLGRTVIFT
jgi:membrane associated rhomboid family serine protease